MFTAHLLAVNVATGAPFLALWCEGRQTRSGDKLAGQLGRHLVRLSLAALGFGVILGTATLFLLWTLHPTYLDALLRVPSRAVWLGVPERLWFAIAELVIFALSMWAYLALWDRLDFKRFSHRLSHRALGWFAGLNILYHLPPLFAIAAVLSERPQLATDSPSYSRMLLDPEVSARFLHTWLAAFAVSGVAVMVYALRQAKHDEAERADAQRLAVWGARMALIPTVLQVVAGTWLTFQLPDSTRRELMGGDWVGSGCFAAAILASLYLMHSLAATALGDTDTQVMRRSIGLVVVVILLMVTVRHRAREARFRARGVGAAGTADSGRIAGFSGAAGLTRPSPAPTAGGWPWFARFPRDQAVRAQRQRPGPVVPEPVPPDVRDA